MVHSRGATMVITFHRQIETVGSHRALISRWSAETSRSSRISQTTRLSVKAQKGQVTNSQTPRVKATPSALCIQKQWDPGRLRGPRQTLWNYSFPPTSSDCWPPSTDGSNCLLIASARSSLEPSLSLTKDWAKKPKADPHQRAAAVRQSASVKLQFVSDSKIGHKTLTSTYKKKRGEKSSLSQNLNVSPSCHIAEEWFHFK